MSDRYDPHLAPGAGKRGLPIGGDDGKAGRFGRISNTHQQRNAVMAVTGWWGTNGFFRAAERCIWCWQMAASASFVPRLPDRNAVRLERLKDKLGIRSKRYSEAEFLMLTAGCWAKRVKVSGKF